MIKGCTRGWSRDVNAMVWRNDKLEGPTVPGLPAASLLLVRGMNPAAAHDKAYWENYAVYGSVFGVFTALIGYAIYKCSTAENKSDAKTDNQQYQIIHYDPPPISENQRNIWKEPKYQRTDLVLCSPWTTRLRIVGRKYQQRRGIVL